MAKRIKYILFIGYIHYNIHAYRIFFINVCIGDIVEYDKKRSTK